MLCKESGELTSLKEETRHIVAMSWGRQIRVREMENVIVLAHDDVVQMAGRALGALQAQLGEAGAEGVVNRAMEEMANRLSLIERCHYQGDKDALWKAAKGLIGIAEQIGLATLADAARSLAECAKGDDAVALAAVMNRLIRLGDRSLTAVWDLPEMSSF